MSEERGLGISSLSVERSLGKRLEEMMSGKGGLISFLWYLDQLDFVDDLSGIINEISSKYTFVDTALTKCAKECLARPEFLREEEIGQMLGYSCISCGKIQAAMFHRYERVCSCGGQFKLRYLLVHKQLRELHIVPTPEAVMMWVAYEGLADCYVLGFLALKRVFGTLTKQFGLVAPSQFVTTELQSKFESQFLYYEPGDPRYCLAPETPVITSEGMKRIDAVKVGDKVLTHKGRFRTVLGVSSRDHIGEIAEIMTAYDNQPTKITLNHVVPVGMYDIKGVWGKNRKIGLHWITIADLVKKFTNAPKDTPYFRATQGKPFALYPKISETKDAKRLDLSLLGNEAIRKLKLRYDESKVWSPFGDKKHPLRINRFIDITPDFLRLVGYYLSEGSCGAKLTFSFHIEERSYIEDVEKLIFSIFGIASHESIVKKSKVCYVVVHSQFLARFFESICGKYAYGKHIPEWIFYLPLDHQKELLTGYFRGDGCAANKQSGIRARTISMNLAYQIKLILGRFDILASILKEDFEVTKKRKINGKTFNFHEIYELHINGAFNVAKLSEIIGFKNDYNIPKPNRSKRNSFYGQKICGEQEDLSEYNNWFLSINSCKISQYNGKVYDLKVEEDETFCLHNMVVHNSKEERELLMVLVRGNVAEVPFAQAEEVIRTGIAVCKFGYLFNKLNCSGADFQYNLVRSKFSLLYNTFNLRVRLTCNVSRKDRDKKTIIEVAKLDEDQYYPCALLPKDYWVTGKLSKHVELKPLEKSKFPIFTDDENLAMNCFIAPSGSGKTTFMGAIIDHAVNWGGEYVFNILSDKKNGLSLSSLPLFPCEGHTNVLLKLLSDMGVQPKQIPTLNLSFLRPDEQAKLLSKKNWSSHPPTIFDRIVDIDDAHSFGLDFLTGPKAVVEKADVVGNRGILNILEEFALKLGYKRLCGIINVVNYQREERTEYDNAKMTKLDIVVGTTLLDKFMIHRQANKFPSGRIAIDELSCFSPTTHSSRSGTDTSAASAVFNESVKDMRGANLEVDTATQSWNEINPEGKKEKFNVFFRSLPKSTDKSHSQRDLILGDLDMAKEEETLAKHIMESNAFPPELHFWFWWNKLSGTIQIVRPNPPRFMLNQPKKTNMEVFKAYERYSGEKVLLDSWDDVPHLHYENDEYFKTGFRVA